MPNSAPKLPSDLPDGNPHYIQAVTDMGEEQEVEAQEDIYASNGMKLLAKGARINRSQFVRLTQHKLRTSLDHALSSGSQLNPAVLAAEAGQLLEQDSMLSRLAGRSGEALRIKHGLAELKLPPPLAFRLTVMQTQRSELFKHSLRCTLIAHMLAVRMRIPPKDQEALLLAAVCHDLGEMHTDPALLASGRRISSEERRFIHVHPITGYVLMRDLAAPSRNCMNAVLQHHERLDGSGYPYGLRGERIDSLGRVMAVAEVTEVMLRRFHQQRVDVMLRLNSARFDTSAVAALRDLLRTETPEVEVSGGEAGLDRQFSRIMEALDAWETFREFFEDVATPDTGEWQKLAFLFERMQEIRSLILQAGINLDDFESSLHLARDDIELLGEMESALDEVNWRLTEIANEIELKAPKLNDLVQVTLNNFIDALRPAQIAEQ